MAWQVNSADSCNGSFDFSAVRIAYKNAAGTDSGFLDIAYADPGEGAYVSIGEMAPNMDDEMVFWANVTGMSDGEYSFMIELVNWDTSTGEYQNTVAQSQWESYSTLDHAGYIDTSLTPVTPAAMWHGSGFKVVPEPTSAMLLIVGLAAAALRRRKIVEEIDG